MHQEADRLGSTMVSGGRFLFCVYVAHGLLARMTSQDHPDRGGGEEILPGGSQMCPRNCTNLGHHHQLWQVPFLPMHAHPHKISMKHEV